MSSKSVMTDIYVCFEEDPDIRWIWKREELKQVTSLWDEGISIWDIADVINEDVDNVALLIFSMVRTGLLKERSKGIKGYTSRDTLSEKGVLT